MARFKNVQDVKEIEYSVELYPFCPLGNENYYAEVSVVIEPNEWIMDYCEETEFMKTLSDKKLIVEELAKVTLDHICAEYDPKSVSVTVKAKTTNHFPVKVTVKS